MSQSNSQIISEESTLSTNENEKVDPTMVDYLMLTRNDFDPQWSLYHENQSSHMAEPTLKEKNTNNIDNHIQAYLSKKNTIGLHEHKAHDRSRKTCQIHIKENIKPIDFESTYAIINDTLEHYIRLRKLNRCKAWSNFADYRRRAQKHEKHQQLSPSHISMPIKENPTKGTPKTPKIEENLLSSSSEIEAALSKTILTSQSSSNKTPAIPSPKIAKEEFIPIPSADLLKPPASKSSQRVHRVGKRHGNISKKRHDDSKRGGSPVVRGAK